MPDVDVPGRKGDIVGMYYDEPRQCWRLNYPCRINGKATHLKATVPGPKSRRTQMEAMRKLIEMQDRAQGPLGSLKFKDVVDKWLESNKHLRRGILTTVNHIRNGLGGKKLHGFKEEFLKWIAAEEKREVTVWRREKGKLKLCGTGKRLSRGTVQAYKRYVKVMLRFCGHGALFDGITIGRRVIRRRPLEPWEMLRLEESCRKLFPWFYPAFDFARCNPIRPEDQFALTVEEHLKGGRLIYAPKKTYPKTGLMAYPIRWEHQTPWYESLVSGPLFPRPGGGSMFGKSCYYRWIWNKIRLDAELPDVQFYDLRHHAVGWMRSCGIEDWRIAKAAGWASTEMLVDYDPDNRHLINEYDKAQDGVVACSTDCSTYRHTAL